MVFIFLFIVRYGMCRRYTFTNSCIDSIYSVVRIGVLPSGKRIHRLIEYTSKLIKDLKIGEQKMSNKVTINNHTYDFMMVSCVIRQLEDAVRCLDDIQEFATDKLLVDMTEYTTKDLNKILKQLAGYVNDNYECED